MSDSATVSGVDGGSLWWDACVGPWFSARDEARRVELEADEEVESSGISTTFHVCRVASGAKETRRFALRRQVLANLGFLGKTLTNPWISGALLSFPV